MTGKLLVVLAFSFFFQYYDTITDFPTYCVWKKETINLKTVGIRFFFGYKGDGWIVFFLEFSLSFIWAVTSFFLSFLFGKKIRRSWFCSAEPLLSPPPFKTEEEEEEEEEEETVQVSPLQLGEPYSPSLNNSFSFSEREIVVLSCKESLERFLASWIWHFPREKYVGKEELPRI